MEPASVFGLTGHEGDTDSIIAESEKIQQEVQNALWDEFDRAASDYETEIVEFLWEGFIPRGRLCYNHGTEGIGKSSIWYDIMASLTKGTIKGIYQGQPVSVAVINPEDGETTGVRPRLELAGADLSRFKIYREIRNPDSGEVETLNLNSPHGLAFLEAMIERHDLKFVLIDNQMATLNIGDSNATSKVATALGPLASLAIKTGVTIVILGHDNKGEHVSVRNVMNGSHAYRSVCRAVFHTVEDETTNRVGLSVVKANEFNKRDVGAMLYEIESVEVKDSKNRAGKIGVANFIEETEQAGYLWDYDVLKNHVQKAAHDKAAAKEQGAAGNDKKPKCIDWVRAWLVENADGGTKEEVVSASQVWGGYSDKSVENAFAALGASSKPQEKKAGQVGRPKAIRFLEGSRLAEAAAYVTQHPCPVKPDSPMALGNALTDGIGSDWRKGLAG